MKICYVSSALGIPDQRFINKFSAKGWEVDVVALGRSAIRETDRIRFHYLLNESSDYLLTRSEEAARYFVYPMEAAKSYIFLKKLLKEIRPDVLHGTWVQSDGFVCALNGFHPFLLMPYGSDILIQPKKSRISRLITTYTIKKADMIACDAENVKREIVRATDYPEEKIAVFPRGVDLSRFRPNGEGSKIRRKLGWEDKRIVIMTRLFKPIYGIEYFLRSIPRIIESVPDTRVILCGTGPLEDEFKSFVSESGLNEKVHFAGFVENEKLPEYLSAADLYVSCSLSDGTSISLLEAMACGLPVVVTDVESNKEWVMNGKNGFVVPRRESFKLGQRVIELLQNDDLRKEFGKRNIQIAKRRANWDENFEKLEGIYQQLIGPRNAQTK